MDATIAAWRIELAAELSAAQTSLTTAEAVLDAAIAARDQAQAARQLLQTKMATAGAALAPPLARRMNLGALTMRDQSGAAAAALAAIAPARQTIADISLALAQLDIIDPPPPGQGS